MEPTALLAVYDDNSEIEVILQTEADDAETASAELASSPADIRFRTPRAEDGATITALIAASPPLDPNSAYCNLLQCSDFADTCIVAERDGRIVGWISGYRPPSAPDRIFVWQVAVDESARGEGLAGRMLDALIALPAVTDATTLTTTITDGNAASWALFRAFARRHDAGLTRTSRFDRDAHLGGTHDTEWEARIAPLPTR